MPQTKSPAAKQGFLFVAYVNQKVKTSQVCYLKLKWGLKTSVLRNLLNPISALCRQALHNVMGPKKRQKNIYLFFSGQNRPQMQLSCHSGFLFIIVGIARAKNLLMAHFSPKD